MANSIPPEVKRFRMAIVPLAIFIFVVSMLGFTLIVIIRDGITNVRWRDLLRIVIWFELPWAIFWSPLIYWLLPAGLSLDGVYGHSFWGFRRFVRWHNIKTVRKFPLPLIPFIRIFSLDGEVTWLPLFQSRPAEFQEAIRKFAPSDSPILNCLDNLA